MLPQEWKFTICNYFKTLSGYKLELCLPRISSVELTQEWMKAFAKLNDGAFVWERSCSTKNMYHQKVNIRFFLHITFPNHIAFIKIETYILDNIRLPVHRKKAR